MVMVRGKGLKQGSQEKWVSSLPTKCRKSQNSSEKWSVASIPHLLKVPYGGFHRYPTLTRCYIGKLDAYFES